MSHTRPVAYKSLVVTPNPGSIRHNSTEVSLDRFVRIDFFRSLKDLCSVKAGGGER